MFYPGDEVYVPIVINASAFPLPASVAYNFTSSSSNLSAFILQDALTGSLDWDVTMGSPVNLSLLVWSALWPCALGVES